MYERSSFVNFCKTYNALHEKYNISITWFPDGLRIKRYHRDADKKESGWEFIGDVVNDITDDIIDDRKGVIRGDSLARTRQLVADLVRCNSDVWKSFVTLTFKENMVDRDQALKTLKSYLKILKIHFPDLKYICVPERQARGALHFHLLLNIPCNSELIPKRFRKKIFNKKKGRYYDMLYYDLPYWKHGYSLAFDCVNDVDDNFSFEKYVCKYMTKDLFDPTAFGRVKVLHSRNLIKPRSGSYFISSLDFADWLNELGVDYHNKKTVNSKCIYCPDYDIYDIRFKND